MKVAIIGAGKTGGAAADSALRRGHEIVAQIRSANAGDVFRLSLDNCDVGVVFTPPAAAPNAIRALMEARIPAVVGTTGWDERRDEVLSLVSAHAGQLLSLIHI
jgi:4-hydroxy-tetrahydrodipicolinate reductase